VSVEGANVVEGIDRGRQAAVQAEDLKRKENSENICVVFFVFLFFAYLLLNQRRQGEEVKQVGKVLPHVGVAVLSEALVVKAIDLGDLAGLVISKIKLKKHFVSWNELLILSNTRAGW